LHIASSRYTPPLINNFNQAAAAIEALALTTPTKPSKKAPVRLIDDRRRSGSPDTIDASSEPAEEVDELEVFRKKFVGEVDLPESESYVPRVIQRILIDEYRRRAIAEGVEAPLRTLPHSISRG
jgi:hypothetical protein